MTISFPDGLDFNLTPSREEKNSTDTSRRITHDDILYILDEVERKIGINDSTDTESLDYRVMQVERKIGINDSTDTESLDYRVMQLENAPVIVPDTMTVVGTTNQISATTVGTTVTLALTPRVVLSGTQSGENLSLSGMILDVPSATYTVTSITSPDNYANFISFGIPTLDGSVGTETYYGANVYIAGKPLDTSLSAYMWLHNGYALWVDADTVRIDGSLLLGGDVLDRTPSYTISFNDDSAKTIGIERTTTAATAGRALTISAGAGYSGGTNLAGGVLNLNAGTSTGSASSTINLKTSTASGSGTADNTPTTKLTIVGNAMTVSCTSTFNASCQFNGQALIGSTNWGKSTYIYVRSGAVNNHVCSMRYDSTYHLDWSEKEMLVYNNHFQIQTATAHDVVIQTNGANDRLRIYSAGSAKFFGDLTVQNLTFDDAKNIVFNTSTGTRIGTATTQKLSFYNANPIVQPSAYTQTYATASKTHPNATASTLTDSTGGTADTTLAAVEATYTQATIRNNFADLCAMVNKLTADNLDVKKLLNQVIDDLQALGLVG